jgi:LacI family transcriptional regulator
MHKRATLKDVAGAVGVHVSTVSRALNPETRHLITPEIVAKVIAVGRQMGYRPNPAAYSLRTNRTLAIGVVVPDITNSIFPPIIRGVEDAVSEHGYATLVVNTDGRFEREAAVFEVLSARGIDGLVVASVERKDEAIARIAAFGTPIVTVNRRTDDGSICSVTNDDADGIRRMLTHLAALGHRSVAAIAGNQRLSTGQRRYEALRTHAADIGLEIADESVPFAARFDEADGERAMEELLARGMAFSAVVCASDRLAIGAITAMRRRGLACPADVSISGFNDMAMVDRIEPPLTTIRIQHYKVGFIAATLLAERMARAQETYAPEHVLMPVELVVRGSTCPPRDLMRATPTMRRHAPVAPA